MTNNYSKRVAIMQNITDLKIALSSCSLFEISRRRELNAEISKYEDELSKLN
ncbi:hypothetical protein BPT24_020 [Tenacibaculum phage pT24]|uniref:Uncharacterized protein n=1 Tax=Tenacibaculum phage pT24 TaxID=1880590 RepID=A0A1B4XWF8_9CAUD|nr:hypothetical protein HYP10_gp020 [Tenacibaculum phage pT24]BAV39142.1 hypothetical protein BPT24_020 [Tenacibaculum phage pT24]